jgi:hypothetical protein
MAITPEIFSAKVCVQAVKHLENSSGESIEKNRLIVS